MISRFGGMRRAVRAAFCLALPSLFSGLATPARAQVDVLTQHNDNARTGQNLNETVLTPAAVQSGKFGKLFSCNVDGYVFAQPLIVSQIAAQGKTRNVVYVVTEHNSVYAFDADDPTAVPLWQRSLGTPVPVPNSFFGNRYGPYHDVDVEIGITGTPVIDRAGNTLYVVAFTQDALGGPYHMMLYGLDLTNGQVKFGGAQEIKATVPGTGDGSAGGNLAFTAVQHLQRPGLLLNNGVLYVALGSHADTDPYHGWVFAYDPATLAMKSVFCTSPNSGESGIWMCGAGPAADSAGNVYFEVGNGVFDANKNKADYGDSFVKIAFTGSALTATDYFTPFNQATLANNDTDLGSGGLLLLPDQPGTAPHLLVGAGKEGKIYLINRDPGMMGKYNTGFDFVTQALGGKIGGTWSSPAYFNQTIYYAGNGDTLKAFPIITGDSKAAQLTTSPTSASATGFNYPGATPAISANGTANGIVWAIESAGSAVLHAYNAANLASELYNSARASVRDNAGGYVKFTVPTIANGKVYVPAQYRVSVYGIGDFLDTPVFTPSGGSSPTSLTFQISTTTPGTVIHYTTNGAAPDASSPTYTGPVTITQSATVRAIAFKTGYAASAIGSADFLIGTGPGDGDGLSASYFPNTTLSGTPVTQIDPTINFIWNGGTPAPGIAGTNFSARWTGQLLPRTTGNYTFTTVSDDGIRVWINGQQIINNWTSHGATADSGTIALSKDVPVSVKVEFYQGVGGSQLTFSYAAPGISNQIVPRNQLYSGNNLTVATPQITPWAGNFFPTATVRISDVTTGAEIHYTTDGSIPTAASPVYTAPFTISQTTTVNAMALKASRVSSAVASAVYTWNPYLSTSHVAINSGGPASGIFAADGKFSGGAGHTRVGAVDTSQVSNPAPELVYQSERIGGFTYTLLGLLPNTPYIVRLHFAENTATGANQRIFNVQINSQPVINNLDIYAAAGGPFIAMTQDIPVTTGAGGVIQIGYATVTGAAKSSGIEVFPAVVPSGLSGKVLLDSLAPNAPAQVLQFQFRPTDGSASFTVPVSVGPDGNFTLPGLPANSYMLAIKGGKWLQKVVPCDTSAGDVALGTVLLSGGDADNNNIVDIADFGLLVNAYESNSSVSGTGYDARADFNCDGLVDIADFGILVSHYGESGDM